MWQFIVSGYVPGTELQITFDMLATFGISLIATYIVWRLTIGRDDLYKQFLSTNQSESFDQTIHNLN